MWVCVVGGLWEGVSRGTCQRYQEGIYACMERVHLTPASAYINPPHLHPSSLAYPSCDSSLTCLLYLRRHSPGRVEPALPRENHGDVSWVGRTPRSPILALLYLLALQLGLKAPEHPLNGETQVLSKIGQAGEPSHNLISETRTPFTSSITPRGAYHMRLNK